jgi:hypothetical protein
MQQLILPGLEVKEKTKPNPLDQVSKNFVKAYNTYEDEDNIVVGPNGQLVMESELKKEKAYKDPPTIKQLEKMEKKAHPNIDFSKAEYNRVKSLLPKQNYTDTYKILKASASKDELKDFPDEIEKAKAREVIKKSEKAIATARSIPVDFEPLPLAASTKDTRADYLEQRFNKMIEDKRQEDLRNSTLGLAGLLGVKDV